MSLKIPPIYIDTGNLTHKSFLGGKQIGFWDAKEIYFKGIYENPTEEILKNLLTKKNEEGINVLNIPLSDVFLTYFFSRFKAEGLKLIKLMYPSTYSIQENRRSLFTVFVSSLAFSVSLYSVISNSGKISDSNNIIISIILLLILLFIGLIVSVKPIITKTYDISKFDLKIATENYAKIISKKLKTSENTAIVFRIIVDTKVKIHTLINLFFDLPKFYQILYDQIGERFRLIVEVDHKQFSEIRSKISNQQFYIS